MFRGDILVRVYGLSKRKVSIRFVNFWRNFDPFNNFFVDLLLEEGLSVQVNQSKNIKVDLEIVSVYFNRNRQLFIKGGRKFLGLSNTPNYKNKLEHLTIPKRNKKSTRRIWFTGENERIPFNADFDGYLSFEPSDESIKNAYLPLWMLSVGWFSKSRYQSRLGVNCHISDLLNFREIYKPKNKQMCAFVGNPEQIRLRAIEILSKKHNVDLFGSYFGNPVKSKFEIASEYKYSLAFENDLYPGYVTEKLIEAYLSLTVPIYRGIFDLKSEIKFNPKSFIDVNNFKTVDELSDYIESLDENAYQEIFSQPLLLQAPNLSMIKSILLDNLE